MPFTFNKFQKAVAIFIVLGFFFLLLVIIFILKGNNFFEKKVNYYTYFSQTYGLSSGTYIKYKGINVGKIKSLFLDTNDQIKVYFVIFKDYNYLMKKDTVVKVSSGLLGGGGLTIIPGKGEDAVENALIYSTDMSEGMNILATNMPVSKGNDLTIQAQQVLEMILDMKPVIYKTLVNLNNITLDVKSITGSLKGDENSKVGNELFIILNSVKDLTKNINDTVMKLNYTLNSKDNTIGSILNDENKLYNSIKTSIDSLNSSINNINVLLSKFNNLPDDLKKTISLLQENLIQLKYVLENLPLIPKSESKASSNINVGR